MGIIPKEATEALARVDEMHTNIAAIRSHLERLVCIEEARARAEGLDVKSTPRYLQRTP